MSVRVVRLKNGEDVICDLYEVTTQEDKEQVVALQMKNPYNVSMIEPEEPVNFEFDDPEMEDQVDVEGVEQASEGIRKYSDPEIDMRPWAPLSIKKEILLKLDDIITAYETYPELIKKYQELVEAENGGDTN